MLPTKTKTEKPKLPPLDNMYQTWHIALRFREGIAGGLSPTTGLAKRYVYLLESGASNELTAALKNHGIISPEDISKFFEQNTQIFPLDENGHHLMGYQIPAALYQAGGKGNIYGIVAGKLGQALTGAGHIVPPRLYFKKGYKVELGESPIHPVREGKKMHTIAMFEVAYGVCLDFETQILRQPSNVPESTYERLWHLAQQEGLGSMRKQNYGRFDLTACEIIG